VFFAKKKTAKNTFSSSINTWTSPLHFTQQKLLFIFLNLYKFLKVSLQGIQALKPQVFKLSLYKLFKFSLQALQTLQSGIYILIKLEVS